MRYSAELAERATAWLALPTEQKRGGDGSGLVELAQVWAAIQGLPAAPACRQCQYSDRVHDLNAYLREYHRFTSTSSAMSDTPQTTYQLKPEYAGQTLTSDDWTKAVTAANLTDEDAEHFIAKGFGHVFQRIGAALVGAGEQVEGLGDELADDSDGDQPTEREQELQAQLEQSEQAFEASKEQYTKVVAEYNENIVNYQAELDAHTATKVQLAEVQQQLTDSQAQVADLQAALTAATAPKPKRAAAPAPTTADTDSTNSDGSAATGSN